MVEMPSSQLSIGYDFVVLGVVVPVAAMVSPCQIGPVVIIIVVARELLCCLRLGIVPSSNMRLCHPLSEQSPSLWQ